MRKLRAGVGLFTFLALAGPLTRVLAQVAAPAATNTRPWFEKRAEIEEYLKTAPIVKIGSTSVGVTHPQHAFFAPGGLVESMAWKPLKPGMYSGFYESYLSEIAGYELDKLLDLDMVPPTVEREVKGVLGAAIMWVPGTKTFRDVGGMPTPPPAQRDRWNRQIIRTKMFDNMIGNIDPNLGNWLFDSTWNLVLIDHSRAFTREQTMPHQLTRIDAALWDRMTALDETSLTTALKRWVGANEIRSILGRRDQMKKDIDKLIKKSTEAAVFVR